MVCIRRGLEIHIKMGNVMMATRSVLREGELIPDTFLGRVHAASNLIRIIYMYKGNIEKEGKE